MSDKPLYLLSIVGTEYAANLLEFNSYPSCSKEEEELCKTNLMTRKGERGKTMVAREFYNAVIALENVPAELKEFAEKEVKALDVKNEKRAAKAAEKKAEVNGPLYEALDAILADGKAHLAGEVAEALGVKIPKVAALVRLAGDKYAKEEVKVEKGKKVAYKLAQ